MKEVKIIHVFQDGTITDNLKNVKISSEAIPLAVKKAIYEIAVATQ